jgi:hypothetical protein
MRLRDLSLNISYFLRSYKKKTKEQRIQAHPFVFNDSDGLFYFYNSGLSDRKKAIKSGKI